MEAFSASLSLCAGNSSVTGEFPSQRPVTRSFDVFLDLGLYQQLSKQWRRWWFETPWRSLWRHCNVIYVCWCSGARPGSRLFGVGLPRLHHGMEPLSKLWPFVRGIAAIRWILSPCARDTELVSLNKLLNKQSSWLWFETRWRSCDVTKMNLLRQKKVNCLIESMIRDLGDWRCYEIVRVLDKAYYNQYTYFMKLCVSLTKHTITSTMILFLWKFALPTCIYICLLIITQIVRLSLSGVPDYFGRNKISSGGDLSHYSSASLY